MIHADGVTKRFGRAIAVSDLTLHVQAGTALALWGSNGAGKTTFIRCLLGILPFRGSIRVHGLDVRRHGKRVRGLIGYVPQELAFHDDMRLGTAMAFFAKLRGAPLKEAASLLARVGLRGHEAKRVRDLSGGMKQRLALAVAMLADPPIIVLDEPTSNLDADGRGEVAHTLQSLRQDGKTIIFASHRPDEVCTLADRVLVLESGRLIRDTTPEALWPAHGGRPGVQTMRLHVSNVSETTAAALLREAGHTVNLNGHGLCVAVPRGEKAGPISTLCRSRIEVRDFELVDDFQIDPETAA